MSTKLRVLLVEDSEDDTFLIARELQRADFNLGTGGHCRGDGREVSRDGRREDGCFSRSLAPKRWERGLVWDYGCADLLWLSQSGLLRLLSRGMKRIGLTGGRVAVGVVLQLSRRLSRDLDPCA